MAIVCCATRINTVRYETLVDLGALHRSDLGRYRWRSEELSDLLLVECLVLHQAIRERIELGSSGVEKRKRLVERVGDDPPNGGIGTICWRK